MKRDSENSGTRLVMLMSQLLIPGPRKIFTPALPKSLGAVRAKASVLKFRKKFRWLLGRCPSPVTVMRDPSAEPVRSTESTVLNPGVNGAPVINEVIPDICQLSKTHPAGR